VRKWYKNTLACVGLYRANCVGLYTTNCVGLYRTNCVGLYKTICTTLRDKIKEISQDIHLDMYIMFPYYALQPEAYCAI
jgi:hypothetical protein